MPTNAHRIFVSHAHEDNEWCRAFVQALRTGGADVWYDEHNLGYGALGEEIERELRARPIFIITLSPAAVSKPWVQREMTAAISLRDEVAGRIILPVMAQKTDIPLFWRDYKRVSGPGDSALTPAEAAGRILHTLSSEPTAAAAPQQPHQPPHPPLPDVQAFRAVLKRAVEALENDQYREAILAYDQALELDSQSAVAWSGKGHVLYSIKRYQEALAAFNKALDLDSLVADAWLGRGRSLCSLADAFAPKGVVKVGRQVFEAASVGRHRHLQDALSAFEQALVLDPRSAAAWYWKGQVLARWGWPSRSRLVKNGENREYETEPEEALTAYERAVTIAPTNASFWNAKAIALETLQRNKEALSAYDQALRLSPRDAIIWNNKIDLLKNMGNTREVKKVEHQRDAALRGR